MHVLLYSRPLWERVTVWNLWTLTSSLQWQNIFVLHHQSVLPSRGAGLPQTAVLQCLQEGPLCSGPWQHRGRAHEPESHRQWPDTGADTAGSCGCCGSGKCRAPAATNGSIPAGSHVLVRGRRKPAVHLRAARMGGGDTGQGFLFVCLFVFHVLLRQKNAIT